MLNKEGKPINAKQVIGKLINAKYLEEKKGKLIPSHEMTLVLDEKLGQVSHLLKIADEKLSLWNTPHDHKMGAQDAEQDLKRLRRILVNAKNGALPSADFSAFYTTLVEFDSKIKQAKQFLRMN